LIVGDVTVASWEKGAGEGVVDVARRKLRTPRLSRKRAGLTEMDLITSKRWREARTKMRRAKQKRVKEQGAKIRAPTSNLVKLRTRKRTHGCLTQEAKMAGIVAMGKIVARRRK
jgi:hypothetical protein